MRSAFPYIVSLVSLSALSSLSTAKDLHLGYIDLQRVIVSVDEGKQARTTLEKDYKAKKAELEEKENELKSLKATLEQQSMILTQEALRKKEEDYQRKFMDFQKILASHQKDIQEAEMKYTAQIVKKVREIVDEVAKSDNFDYIFEKTEHGLLYGPAQDDMTERVIALYNKKRKTSGK